MCCLYIGSFHNFIVIVSVKKKHILQGELCVLSYLKYFWVKSNIIVILKDKFRVSQPMSLFFEAALWCSGDPICKLQLMLVIEAQGCRLAIFVGLHGPNSVILLPTRQCQTTGLQVNLLETILLMQTHLKPKIKTKYHWLSIDSWLKTRMKKDWLAHTWFCIPVLYIAGMIRICLRNSCSSTLH